MRVFKPCCINMLSSIDEPFRFNASLRHIIVNHVLVVNTLVNSYYSLSFTSYLLLLNLFFILKLVPSFGPDIGLTSSGGLSGSSTVSIVYCPVASLSASVAWSWWPSSNSVAPYSSISCATSSKLIVNSLQAIIQRLMVKPNVPIKPWNNILVASSIINRCLSALDNA